MSTAGPGPGQNWRSKVTIVCYRGAMRALRILWQRPELIAGWGAMILAASVFLTLPPMQGGHHGGLDDCSYGDRHGGMSITMIVLVPMQLAAFAGMLALLQSRHIKIAVGLARIIAALGLVLLYLAGVFVFAESRGLERLIGPGLVVVAELLRRAATWHGHSPFQVARFGAVGAGVAAGLIGFFRVVEPGQPRGVLVALAGAVILSVGCVLTMWQLHRARNLPAVPAATVA